VGYRCKAEETTATIERIYSGVVRLQSVNGTFNRADRRHKGGAEWKRLD